MATSKTQKAIRIFISTAVMLLLTVFYFALPVGADGNTPKLNAWLSGEELNAVVENDTEIDAIFVNGKRINYNVNGTVAVNVLEYARDDASINVHAVDFAGNKSNTVTLQNPFSAGTTAVPLPPVQSSPPVTQASASSDTSSEPPISSPEPSSTPEPATAAGSPSPSPESESSTDSEPSGYEMPGQLNPFTMEDGTGEVVDNADGESDGKEFFTITTPDENTFYLVIDRQRGNHNVYFLNAVTETDLKALAEKDDSGFGDTEVPASPTPEPTPEATPEPSPEPEEPPEKKSNTGAILLILLLVIGGAAVVYYLKVIKPKQEEAAFDDDDDFDDDEPEDSQYMSFTDYGSDSDED